MKGKRNPQKIRRGRGTRASVAVAFVVVLLVLGAQAAPAPTVAGKLDTRDPYAGPGMFGATANLSNITAMGGTLYVFALPEAGGPA
ncbi:MAG TPA: hypothetical protein VIM92_05105 [Rhodanobacteraceae bacterium]